MVVCGRRRHRGLPICMLERSAVDYGKILFTIPLTEDKHSILDNLHVMRFRETNQTITFRWILLPYFRKGAVFDDYEYMFDIR
jgi:hypothetical protein